MAKTKAYSCLPLIFLLMMFLSFNPGGTLEIVNGERKTWCAANPYASTGALQGILTFICSQIDCSIIKKGGQCYEPNTVGNHASVALNLYYQSHGRKAENCRFKGLGLIAITDPSYGNCKFE